MFRYAINKDESDPKLNKVESEYNTSSIKWYTYLDDDLEYDNVLCLNCEFAPIVDKVKEFRDLIERTDFSLHHDSEWFSDFPRGCCGDTANLLWKFLQINFNGKYDSDIRIKNGEKNGRWHAWLEYRDTIVIDVTADQFHSISEPVIITTDKEFYREFRRHDNNVYIEPDFDMVESYNRARLSRLYNLICRGDFKKSE